MTRPARATTPDADDVPGALSSLAVAAPSHLADNVLVEAGLVDRMAPFPSPVGTLWIAGTAGA